MRKPQKERKKNLSIKDFLVVFVCVKETERTRQFLVEQRQWFPPFISYQKIIIKQFFLTLKK